MFSLLSRALMGRPDRELERAAGLEPQKPKTNAKKPKGSLLPRLRSAMTSLFIFFLVDHMVTGVGWLCMVLSPNVFDLSGVFKTAKIALIDMLGGQSSLFSQLVPEFYRALFVEMLSKGFILRPDLLKSTFLSRLSSTLIACIVLAMLWLYRRHWGRNNTRWFYRRFHLYLFGLGFFITSWNLFSLVLSLLTAFLKGDLVVGVEVPHMLIGLCTHSVLLWLVAQEITSPQKLLSRRTFAVQMVCIALAFIGAIGLYIRLDDFISQLSLGA